METQQLFDTPATLQLYGVASGAGRSFGRRAPDVSVRLPLVSAATIASVWFPKNSRVWIKLALAPQRRDIGMILSPMSEEVGSFMIWSDKGAMGKPA